MEPLLISAAPPASTMSFASSRSSTSPSSFPTSVCSTSRNSPPETATSPSLSPASTSTSNWPDRPSNCSATSLWIKQASRFGTRKPRPGSKTVERSLCSWTLTRNGRRGYLMERFGTSTRCIPRSSPRRITPSPGPKLLRSSRSDPSPATPETSFPLCSCPRRLPTDTPHKIQLFPPPPSCFRPTLPPPFSPFIALTDLSPPSTREPNSSPLLVPLFLPFTTPPHHLQLHNNTYPLSLPLQGHESLGRAHSSRTRRLTSSPFVHDAQRRSASDEVVQLRQDWKWDREALGLRAWLFADGGAADGRIYFCSISIHRRSSQFFLSTISEEDLASHDPHGVPRELSLPFRPRPTSLPPPQTAMSLPPPKPGYLPLPTTSEEEKFDTDPSSPGNKKAQPSTPTTKFKAIGLVFLLLGLSFASYAVTSNDSSLKKDKGGGGPPIPVPDVPGVCEEATFLKVVAPKKNVWANINIPEATALRRWLHAEEQGLNLTKASQATDQDNSLVLVEAFTPPKEITLAYLNGSSSSPPPKFAHAIVHHGSAEDPYVQDWLVGPLPISEKTTLRPLREVYHVPEVPFNARGFGGSFNLLRDFMHRLMEPLDELTLDLFGAVSRGNMNDTLVAGGTSPQSFDGSWRRMWLSWKMNVPGSYLHVVDLFTYVDMSGTDASKWHLITLVYNEQVFNSTADFIDAWKSGTLRRSEKPTLGDEGWADRSRKGNKRDLDHLAGPRTVQFNGPRFRIDEEEQYITWMGWEFYLGFERDMGLNLFNINFRGERIIYEISPQEAMAQYSGNDPHQASCVWLDRAFGMGATVRPLLVGYDCPAHAAYLPATVHEAGGSSTREKAICVFERDTGMALSRHSGWMKNEFGAVKAYEVVIRTVSTVGNYDYVFQTTFMLDGTIEVRVSASGYLQGTVYTADQAAFGTRIRESSMGSLHDHVINYKIDFDVAGTRNSLVALTLENETTEQPWFGDDWGTNPQQVIKKRTLKTEDEGRLEYPKNGQGMYVVVNEELKNRWGESRGYAIHPGASPVHLTNLESRRTLKNVQWAKNHLSVSRRKDTELWSSTQWNINLPGDPTIDFDKYFDGESLEQEDLVVWLNLGTHHIPRAEDSPHTLTNIATSSVLLTPFNFNDFDVSMESQNAILLQPPSPGSRGELWNVDENQVENLFCLPAKAIPFSYNGMLSYDEDGNPESEDSIQEARMKAEGIHGLWAGRPTA